MSKGILISSLGANYQVISEAVEAVCDGNGGTFYSGDVGKASLGLFRERLRARIGDFVPDEVWLIATERSDLKDTVGKLLKDFENIGIRLDYKIWVLAGCPDILSETDERYYKDLAMRVVAYAHKYAGGDNRIVVSLAGGRKTMSADIQDAAYCFGSNAMMHVAADKDSLGQDVVIPILLQSYANNDLMAPVLNGLKEDECFGPVDVSASNKVLMIAPGDSFLGDVEKRRDEARHFYLSAYRNKDSYDTFPVLYTLSEKVRDLLKSERVGECEGRKASELEMLRGLPKADLHCHLGGCLSVAEMVRVACTVKKKVEEQKRLHPLFAAWDCGLPAPSESWKQWRKRVAESTGVNEIFVVPGFLISYEDRIEDLEQVVFGSYLDERNFVAIAKELKDGELDMSSYERLGDLQGSSLLCHEETLRECVRVLMENARHQNLRYLEIRCSPLNYAKEDFLSAEDVVAVILGVLEEFEDVKTSLIFIASRHAKTEQIQKGIELYQNLKRREDLVGEMFNKRFRGFDLAGNECSKSAAELACHFEDVKRDCLNITIHAGETMDVDSIWQAVYKLNAERIGHGLTLVDDGTGALQNKFRDRGIGIEMCPSSNYQIVGYRDNYYPGVVEGNGRVLKNYPLREYLESGLRVCVNTDDPGISRTDITGELLKAARLTHGGLSLWEIFALLYNSFDLAFLPQDKKRALMKRMDDDVRKWLEGYIRQVEKFGAAR